jgi:hypothetical protein
VSPQSLPIYCGKYAYIASKFEKIAKQKWYPRSNREGTPGPQRFPWGAAKRARDAAQAGSAANVPIARRSTAQRGPSKAPPYGGR